MTSFPSNYLYIKIKLATEMLYQSFLVLKRVGFFKTEWKCLTEIEFY